MKRATPRTWELVHALASEGGFWDRLMGRLCPALRAFEEIGASGDVQIIPELLGFVLSPLVEVQKAAAAAIGRLLNVAEAADYVQLDELARHAWASASPPHSAWRDLRPAGVTRLRELPAGGLLVGLASFHNSGYVREAAIQELSSITDGSEIPFLLVRLNDWVETVRARALDAVFKRAVPNYAGHFLENLRLVDRLRACRRESHARVVQAIEALLMQPEAVPQLRERIASNDRWFRRYCFRLARESGTDESFRLLKDSLADPDPIVRLWAARGLLPRASDDALTPLLRTLRHDPFMPVRCEAVNAIATRCPGVAVEELRDALFDPHASVRAAARYHLERRGVADFRCVYRGALASGNAGTARVAVAGLGETGKPEDAECLRPFLVATSVGLRKAALRSVAALAGDRFLGELVAALKDDSRGVSATARIALRRRLSLLDPSLLWETFRVETRSHVRRNVLRLLFHLPTWSRLPFIIKACADTDVEIAGLARQRLQDWRRRSARATPTGQDLATLSPLLAEYEACLDPGFVREMRFLQSTPR